MKLDGTVVAVERNGHDVRCVEEGEPLLAVRPQMVRFSIATSSGWTAEPRNSKPILLHAASDLERHVARAGQHSRARVVPGAVVVERRERNVVAPWACGLAVLRTSSKICHIDRSSGPRATPSRNAVASVTTGREAAVAVPWHATKGTTLTAGSHMIMN